MLAVKRPFGIPLLLTTLFLLTVTSIYLRDGVTTHFTKVSIFGEGFFLGEQESVPTTSNGLRLVVFGDSFAASTVEYGYEGKGASWTTTLCEQLDCESMLDFAQYSCASSFPSDEPHGVVTATDIHENAIAQGSLPSSNLTLPDFATQVQSFISHPTAHVNLANTIFIASFGFWDIYNLANHDFETSLDTVENLTNSLFAQLTVLHTHFEKSAPTQKLRENSTDSKPVFRIIIPKLLDPSLVPGWQTQRPLPSWPSSVAEQQKNAAYLTEKWNLAIENGISKWLKTPKASTDEQKRIEVQASNKDENPPIIKDAFYYDLPEYILSEIVERSLEIEGLSDAHGVGTGDSAFDEVYLSCVSDDADASEDEYQEFNGKMVCKSPEDFLWWDAWSIGSVANKAIGKSIAQMVKSGDSLRKAWTEAKKEGFV